MQTASQATPNALRVELIAKDTAKGIYTYEGFKQVLFKDINRWSQKVLERFHEVVIGLCLMYLVLQVFSVTTLMTMACLAWSTQALIKKKLDSMLELGMAHYLPKGMRNALLNRSLLDMLCDLWFIPTISLYLKTILAPIISSKKRDPEEAVKYLEPLEPHHRRIFITKGLAFLFPKIVTKILLPKNYYATQPINKSAMKKGTFLSDIDESDDESHRTGLPPMLVPTTSSVKGIPPSPQRVLPLPFSEISKPEELVRNPSRQQAETPDNLVLGRAVSADPNQSARVEGPPQITDFSKPEQQVELRHSSTVGSGGSKKSKVLISSKLLRMMNNMPGRIDPSWDNINEYRRRANLGIKKTASSDKLDVLQLIMDLKRLEFLKKVNMGMAAKVTGGATVSLFALLYFFKRTRNWMRNFGLLCLFAATLVALGSGVTMGLTAYKTKRIDKEEKRRLEDEAEAAEQAREWETKLNDQRQDQPQQEQSLDEIPEESSN